MPPAEAGVRARCHARNSWPTIVRVGSVAGSQNRCSASSAMYFVSELIGDSRIVPHCMWQ